MDVTGSNGGDKYANGMVSLTNGSGISKTDPSDPSTWSFSGNAYQDEWMAWYLTGALNSKVAWAAFDLGSPTSMDTLYLFNNNYSGGVSGVNSYNLYYTDSPTVALPAQPAKNTYAVTGLTPQGDYDFSSGVGTTGWTLLGPGTVTKNGISTVDVSALTARYLAIEILTNHGDTYKGGRVGLDEVAITSEITVADNHTWAGVSDDDWDNGVTGKWTNDLDISTDWADYGEANFTGATSGNVDVTGDILLRGMVFDATHTLVDNGGSLEFVYGDTITTNANATLKAPIVGTNGITKAGNSTLILEGANTFTGDTSISAGTLQIGTNNTAGSTLGAAGTYSGNIAIAGGAQLIFNTQTSQILDGVISGDGSLRKAGGGTLTLSGANTYTGKTTVAALGAGGPTLSVSSFNSVNGGTPLMASSSLGAPTTVANGTIDLGSGSNVRNCTLIYTGAGETTDRVMHVSFNSSSKHTIDASGSDLLKFTSAFTINPSSGNTSSGLTLKGSGDGEIAAGMTGNALPGYLDKDGSGTWTLGGTTNVNSTTVKNGSLIVNGTLNAATTVTVNSGATLGGSGTVAGAVTVASGAMLDGTVTVTGNTAFNGTVSPGNSIGEVTVENGPATFADGSSYDWEFDSGSADLIAIDGDLFFPAPGGIVTINALPLNGGGFDVTNATYDLFTFTGSFTDGTTPITTANIGSYVNLVRGNLAKWTTLGTLEVNGNAVQLVNFTYIPEPSTIILAGLGLMGVTFRRRRR